MFSDDDLSLIKEACDRDSKALEIKIETIVADLSRLGKQLSDLKVMQARVRSVLEAIKDQEEDNE